MLFPFKVKIYAIFVIVNDKNKQKEAVFVPFKKGNFKLISNKTRLKVDNLS